MKAGEFVVYPQFGVCVVKRVEKRELAGKDKEFFVLESLYSKMVLMCPSDPVEREAAGLRALSTKEQVDAGFRLMKDRSAPVEQTTWNRRYREYMEMLSGGKLGDVALVLRNLAILRKDKDLSFGERKMIESATRRFASEAALVYQISQDHAEEMVFRAIE